MNTYTAYFYTDAEYARTEIEASTPEQALTLAREMDQGETIIGFEHYDDLHPVNHIEILDENSNELAHWRDGDLLLRMAAPDLLRACLLVEAYGRTACAFLRCATPKRLHELADTLTAEDLSSCGQNGSPA